MMKPTPPRMLANRYQLGKKLGQGGMGAVYRAYDRLTQETIALKQLTIPVGELDFNSRVSRESGADDNDPKSHLIALINEFRTLASLRHPNIISVRDYGLVAGQPFFTMDLLSEAQPLTHAARQLDLEGRVDLVVQLLRALTYLHRRGIIHRDLKPANVAVTAGQVRLLDFGLALTEDVARKRAGTLAYMAPETLRQMIVLPQSDLYAVGVMLYEIFAGRLPFGPTNIVGILRQEPDLSPLDAPPALQSIIGQLLMKTPQDRHLSASELIRDLYDAIDAPVTLEDDRIRESVLQAATFVGRQTEMADLTQALTQAVQGRGQTILIGGESGVGKSRLMDELRVQALVQGVRVLRGQAMESGGLSYQLWREIARHLVLSAPDLSDDEASVLKDLVPDMHQLLGREVANAPELTGSAYQTRLRLTFMGLLKRQSEPCLLLLDDLQWAGASLAWLQAIAASAPEHPWLIVGSYRHDEAPSLPDELPAARRMLLPRLETAEIVRLSTSILGRERTHDEIVDLLDKETEGNAFFIVETLRTLAVEAGSLDAIGLITLPNHIITEGMLNVGRRRLHRLPLDDQPLLRAAAVAGRALDLALLRAIDPVIALDDWLLRCQETALLEVQEGQWRFAHDKLRESILGDLDASQRPRLHSLVAQAIETVYPDDAAYDESLLEHWRVADDDERIAHYAHRVAHRHLEYGGKYSVALDLLRDALAITPDEQQLKLWVELAQAYTISGNLTEAQHAAQEALRRNPPEDVALRAQIYRRFTGIAQAQGQGLRALAYGRLALIYHEMEESAFGIARAYGNLGNAHRLVGNYRLARTYLQASIRHSRAINDRLGVVIMLNNLGQTLNGLGDLDGAVACYREIIPLSAEIGDRFGEAAANTNLAVIYGVRGEYHTALELTRRGYELFTDMGEQRGVAVTLSNLGQYTAYLGDPDLARGYLQQALTLNQTMGSLRSQGKCHQYLGELALAQGQDAEAQAALETALTLFRQINNAEGIVSTLNSLGALEAYRHQNAAAASHLEEALKLGRQANLKEDVARSQMTQNFIEDEMPPARLAESLQSAQQLGIPWLLGAVILTAGRYAWRQRGDPSTAVMYLSAVNDAVLLPPMLRFFQTRLHDDLQARCAAGVFNAAWELGRGCDLNALAEALNRELAEAT